MRQIIFDVQKLGSAIEAEVTKQFLPKVLADYQNNKQVVVPGLCITRQYISNSDEKLPWQQLSEIKVGPDKLIIKEKSSPEDWVTASIPQFPNLCVLIELLTYIKQEQYLDMQMHL